ncbi:hypothetical protein IE53DRAFT_367611 [Violaceomyces palustris]|uniref:Uncharacterized protein n=1 Tax=Violaceomyces palustris TaxID=1673888 RepID=A0ACD0P1J8_9BASI|nr:hypothetical protein IE53DRAFT_367611 [Violaceomyces palustris]
MAAINATASAASTLSHHPFYFSPTPSVIPAISDKYLSLLLPIITYWSASLAYHALDVLQLPFTEKYRIHESKELTSKNRVTVTRVIVMVAIQQFIQTVLGLLVLEDDATGLKQTFADHAQNVADLAHVIRSFVSHLAPPSTAPSLIRLLDGTKDANRAAWWLYWWGIPVAQFWFAFFIMDAWQYFWHRAFHESRFLYRHFHSHHHRLYVPYAFGALYNHPVEGLVLDSAGAALSHFLSRMTVRQGIVFFTFSTFKTVSDHGGYAFPWYLDPLHLIFPNNAEYHDVHHQMRGLKYNYSQPFFVHFDSLFGTRISAEDFRALNKSGAKRSPGSRSKEEKSGPATASSSGTEEVGKQEVSLPAGAQARAVSAVKPSHAAQNPPSLRRSTRKAEVETDVTDKILGQRDLDAKLTCTIESYIAKAGATVA